MTDLPQTDLAEVLDRVYRAVHDTPDVITDGFTRCSWVEVESIGAELGFTRLPAPGSTPYGTFGRDPDAPAHLRTRRLVIAFRVAEKAGADADDMAALRAAAGVERNDLQEEFAERIDEGNRRSHRYWIERYERGRAIEVANARKDERRKAIKELIDASGDSELRSFPEPALTRVSWSRPAAAEPAAQSTPPTEG